MTMMMHTNKKAFGWLQIVIVLALLVLIVYAMFNVFLPQITAAAEALHIIEPGEKPNVEYDIATLETQKGLVESYLARVGSEIELHITLNGEIHRTGFVGETCLVCTDYVFEKSERIPFTQLTRGTKTQRIDASAIVGGASEENLDSIDSGSVEMTVGLVQKGYAKGFTLESRGTWSVLVEMVDEQGNPMMNEKGKPLKLLLATLSNVQAQGREITYQVRSAYEYDDVNEEQEKQELTEVVRDEADE